MPDPAPGSRRRLLIILTVLVISSGLLGIWQLESVRPGSPESQAGATMPVAASVAGAQGPRVTLANGAASVLTPLITVTVDPGKWHPVEMAFSHDGKNYSGWEPYRSTLEWPLEDMERAYWDALRTLNGGSAFSTWDNEYGSLAWGESFILLSLLDMFETTADEAYLREFVTHADALLARGDDAVGRPDYRGLIVPGWSASGYLGLGRTVFADSAGNPMLEVLGRTRQWQDEISVRLSSPNAATDNRWTLDIHRSVAGVPGFMGGDDLPLTSAPTWDVAVWPAQLESGSVVAYDTRYPWLAISELRLYGHSSAQVATGDFEVYVGMHADRGEYVRLEAFDLQAVTDQGPPFIAFRFPGRQGRYWKVRYVGRHPFLLEPDAGTLIRLYWMPPLAERFVASDLTELAARVDQGSELVRLNVVDDQWPQSSDWRFLTTGRFRLALHTGLITHPLLEFVRQVENRRLGRWRPQAARYLSYAWQAVDSHEAEWRAVSATTGYYVFREGEPYYCNGVNLPFNQLAAIGRSLLLLGDITHVQKYHDRAAAIAQVMYDHLTYEAEAEVYEWPGWFGEGYGGWQSRPGRVPPSWEGYKEPEAIWYASLDMDFALAAYERGIVFSREDMRRLAQTFLKRLTTTDGRLHVFVTGEGEYETRRTAAEFLGLTVVEPAVYARVEAIQVLPAGVQDSHRTPYTVSRLVRYAPWRLSPGQGLKQLCVRLRDAGGNVSPSACGTVSLMASSSVHLGQP